MSKFPKEYLEDKIADPSEIYKPEFRFDTRGNLVLPFTPYHKMILKTTPGSKDVKYSTEASDGSPATDPASIKTGAIYAETVITIGPTSGWRLLLSGGDASYPMAYTNGVATNFYIDKSGNLYLKGIIEAEAGGIIGGWTIGSNNLYAGSGATRVGMAPGSYPFYAGAETPSSAPFYVNNSGDVVASSITIHGRSGQTLADAINASGNLITDIINARLDTSSKNILSDFNFGSVNYAGGVKAGDIAWNTSTGAITGGSGIVVYRKGIVGATTGVVTFSIDATTGDATFSGQITGSTIIGGIIKTAESGDYVMISSSPANKIEFYYDDSSWGGITCEYNPLNYLTSVVVESGGGAYLACVGKSNMGSVLIGLANRYFGLTWESGDSGTERITTDARVDADWLPYGTHDLGSGTYKWQHLYLSGNIDMAGNITVTGTVDGVNVSAHESRHEYGGADALILTSVSSGSNKGISAGWAYTHVNTASAHHSSTSNGLAITPSSVTASGVLQGGTLNINVSSIYNYINGALILGGNLTPSSDNSLQLGESTSAGQGSNKRWTKICTVDVYCDADLFLPVNEGNIHGDLIPTQDSYYEIGQDAVRWLNIYGDNFPACDFPTHNSAIGLFKKIANPIVRKGELGKRHYFSDEDFPEEMKCLVSPKAKKGGKTSIEMKRVLGVAVQAIRELIVANELQAKELEQLKAKLKLD